mgnify:CR=1 FL=1
MTVVTVVTAIITVVQFSESQHVCGILDEQLGVCVRGGNGVVIFILSQFGCMVGGMVVVMLSGVV